jgi:hypothetical protein
MHGIKLIHERKKMYKTALVVSSFIIILGLLIYLRGMNAGRIDTLFFVWIVVSSGFICCVYSFMNWY